MATTPAPYLTPAPPPTPTPGGDRVRVYVRGRPLHPHEQDINPTSALSFIPHTNQVVVEDGSKRVFKYAGVFGEDSTQSDVFDVVVNPLLMRVRQGISCTVLAYGQTGSGKTHTMGTHPTVLQEDEGILQRAIRALLSCEDEVDHEKKLTISMLEVYNETLYDLLTPARQELSSKPTRGGGLQVLRGVEEEVCSVEEGMMVLERGSSVRSTTSTSMNQHSSRSHALIQLTYICNSQRGALRLVDLAGSECVGRIAENSASFSEGININKTLLTLNKVLAALTMPAPGFVPYRESVLTRLLKDFVEGTGLMLMVACVTPFWDCLAQTLTTLRYAQQATNVKPRPLMPPPSTIKKSCVKRGRSEDVTVTPGAWKRRAKDSEAKEHNTTVSTPGHHPPSRFRPTSVMNISLDMTPSRPNDTKRRIKGPQHRVDNCFITPLPLPPPPPPPVFKDDLPTSFSNVPSFSPIMDQVKNHLDQTMSMMEERIVDSIVTRLTTRKRKSSRSSNSPTRSMRRYKNSTPVDVEKENRKESDNQKRPYTRKSRQLCTRRGSKNSSFDSSEDEILNITMKTLLGGRKMKRLLKKIMNSSSLTDSPQENTRNGRGLADITNTVSVKQDPEEVKVQEMSVTNLTETVTKTKSHDDTVRTYHSGSDGTNFPITSTAVFDGRAVRRSTRMSTRLSYHAALARNLSNEDLTQFMSHNNADITSVYNIPSPTSPQSPSFLQDTTVMFQNDGSPELRVSNMKKLVPSDRIMIENEKCPDVIRVAQAQAGEKTKQKVNDAGKNTDTIFPTSKMDITEEVHNQTFSVQNKTKTRKKILPQQKVAPSDPNVTICDKSMNQTLNDTISRCRSQRRCAQISIQRNRQLLEEENYHRRRSITANTSRTMGKKASDGVGVKKKALRKSLQEEHSQTVLHILNEGDLRALQKLPTIGPKTAMVIMQYRKLYGQLESVDELKHVPALSKNYYSRFIQANMLELQ